MDRLLATIVECPLTTKLRPTKRSLGGRRAVGVALGQVDPCRENCGTIDQPATVADDGDVGMQSIEAEKFGEILPLQRPP